MGSFKKLVLGIDCRSSKGQIVEDSIRSKVNERAPVISPQLESLIWNPFTSHRLRSFFDQIELGIYEVCLSCPVIQLENHGEEDSSVLELAVGLSRVLLGTEDYPGRRGLNARKGGISFGTAHRDRNPAA